MLFTLIGIYTVLRNVKIVLIASSPYGTDLLSVLRDYSLMLKIIPLGLFFFVYRRNNLPQILLYTSVSILSLFILFHFWGFQNASLLHPDPASIQEMLQKNGAIPQLVTAYGVWSYSLYYFLSDIWGLFIIGFLFWALANQTFTLQESKLSYPLLAIFGSLGALVGGLSITSLNHSEFKDSMHFMGYFLLGGLFLFLLGCLLIQKLNIMKIPSLAEERSQKIKTSYKFIYLFLIFLIITTLELSEQLYGLLFKVHVKNAFPSGEDYNQFMGIYSTYSFYISSIILLLTCWLIWKFGWLKSALIPPIFVFIYTCFFLVYTYFTFFKTFIDSLFTTTFPPILWIFAIQSIVFLGLKTLFFATKEIAFIPLAITTKARGKGIVDYLLLGTSIWLGSLALSEFNLIPIENNLMGILFIILAASILWILSVTSLGKMFKTISGED